MPMPESGSRQEAAPGPERLLADLTAEQAQAVTHGSGPLLLLLAGPGAGKTQTLTRRAAHLLATGRPAVGDPRRHIQRPRQVSCACGSPTCSARTSREPSARRHFTRCARACCASTRACSAAPSATRSTTRPTRGG